MVRLDGSEEALVRLALALAGGADVRDAAPAALACGLTVDEVVAVAVAAGRAERQDHVAGHPPVWSDRAVWSDRVPVDLGDHTTVVARRSGAGGTALVLCHCVALDHRLWEPLVSALPPDIEVLAYDVRGHGEARSAPTFRWQDCVDDLLGILDAHSLSRVHLCGISMGGVIAQEFAIAHPERLAGLTLMATSGAGRRPSVDRARRGRERGLADQVGATLARWCSGEFVATNGPWVRYIRHSILSWDVDMWSQAWTALGTRETLSRLGGIPTPTLCVAAESDVSTPASSLRALADAIPDSRFARVPGPHLFVLEHADELAPVLMSHHSRLD